MEADSLAQDIQLKPFTRNSWLQTSRKKVGLDQQKYRLRTLKPRRSDDIYIYIYISSKHQWDLLVDLLVGG